MVCRAGKEVVQRLDAQHHRRQRGGNLRVAHIGNVRDAIDLQIVNFGAEGALDLRRRAAEADRQTIRSHFIHRKAVTGQPVFDGGKVGLGGTEVFAHLLGREPLMEVGRIGIVLAGDKLFEGGLLRRVAAEHQDQVAHAQIGADPAAIVLGAGGGVGVAPERHPLAFIDAIDNAHGGGKALCLHGRRAKEERAAEQGRRSHPRAGQQIPGDSLHRLHTVVLDPSFGGKPPNQQKVALAIEKT